MSPDRDPWWAGDGHHGYDPAEDDDQPTVAELLDGEDDCCPACVWVCTCGREHDDPHDIWVELRDAS